MSQLTLSLIVFLIPLAYSPGPGNLFFAANGARFGLMATWPANIGYHSATLLVSVLIGIGFASASEHSPTLVRILKYAGSTYVLYLAWIMIRAGALADTTEARPASFLDGILLLILNPKAYVIIALMFSQFLVDTEQNKTLAIVWISAVFTANNLVAFLFWIILGDQIANRFRNPEYARKMNFVFGTMLAAVAIWMATA